MARLFAAHASLHRHRALIRKTPAALEQPLDQATSVAREWGLEKMKSLAAAAKASQLLSSSRPRRLLGGGNSDQVAIERNGPVDGGRFISRDQPVGVLSCAHDAVVAPNVVRFAIEKVHRLQLTSVKDR